VAYSAGGDQLVGTHVTGIEATLKAGLAWNPGSLDRLSCQLTSSDRVSEGFFAKDRDTGGSELRDVSMVEA
jgi:hypothetical protein